MSSILAGIFQKLRERRLARAAKFLEALKIRYHTFRILLANNEYSLDLMRSLDQSLRSGSSDLPEVTEELLSVTYELVDGLNRLSEGRHQRLFETHYSLAGAIRKELDASDGGPIPCAGLRFPGRSVGRSAGRGGREGCRPGAVAQSRFSRSGRFCRDVDLLRGDTIGQRSRSFHPAEGAEAGGRVQPGRGL